jgi:hypothetical protein
MSTIGAKVQWMPAAVASTAVRAVRYANRLEAGRLGQRNREHRAHAVNHVGREQQRDAEPGFLDRHLLDLAPSSAPTPLNSTPTLPAAHLLQGLLGIARVGFRVHVRRKRPAHVGEHAELADLLFDGHAGDQGFDAGRTAWGMSGKRFQPFYRSHGGAVAPPVQLQARNNECDGISPRRASIASSLRWASTRRTGPAEAIVRTASATNQRQNRRWGRQMQQRHLPVKPAQAAFEFRSGGRRGHGKQLVWSPRTA